MTVVEAEEVVVAADEVVRIVTCSDLRPAGGHGRDAHATGGANALLPDITSLDTRSM
jgi:hypothetical protein